MTLRAKNIWTPSLKKYKYYLKLVLGVLIVRFNIKAALLSCTKPLAQKLKYTSGC